MRVRRISAALAAAALLAGGVALVPTAAYASLSSITCVGTSEVAYSPPITPALQLVTATVDADYSACVAVLSGAITSATSTSVTSTSQRSCANILGVFTAAFSIPWNTGQVSAGPATVTTTQLASALQVVSAGTFASGPFTGNTFVYTVTYANVDAVTECQNGGLSSLDNGRVLLQVTPL
ncbi:hypothetical protein F4553_001175 [Allocatelliglobosispora scoriae]|uniref:Tat pathway signal sequence domain protein n=1 Tax=Allocatelliglobosispora scoriae TaxID=643052 RepID=A0A841BKN7_9ACTN|nr:hypothetical protein [Allocatelliglobosispora scoriae]MBB5867796.1 hypothetical protein [Allocatelliglobosispora scoriae]